MDLAGQHFNKAAWGAAMPGQGRCLKPDKLTLALQKQLYMDDEWNNNQADMITEEEAPQNYDDEIVSLLPTLTIPGAKVTLGHRKLA